MRSAGNILIAAGLVVLYGLPNNRDFAAGWDSYALRKDILNKYNIKASDIKNIKDLEKVFDLVLEKENGVVPLACTVLSLVIFSCRWHQQPGFRRA